MVASTGSNAGFSSFGRASRTRLGKQSAEQVGKRAYEGLPNLVSQSTLRESHQVLRYHDAHQQIDAGEGQGHHRQAPVEGH